MERTSHTPIGLEHCTSGGWLGMWSTLVGLEVIPFLVLAVGVDNMFVLAHAGTAGAVISRVSVDCCLDCRPLSTQPSCRLLVPTTMYCPHIACCLPITTTLQPLSHHPLSLCTITHTAVPPSSFTRCVDYPACCMPTISGPHASAGDPCWPRPWLRGSFNHYGSLL
jgi:hypothetical protein